MTKAKYTDVKKFEEKIDDYFKDRKERHLPPTVSGLAIWLGFEDRRSIYDYAQRGEFSHTVKRALLYMEDYAERMLFDPDANKTGTIFWLKNHRWVDKTEQDVVHFDGYSLFEKRTEEKAKKYEDRHIKRSSSRNGK